MLKSSSWKHDLALLATVLVWGLNFPFLKAVLEVMHPHVVNVFRFVVSAVVLGILYAWQQQWTWSRFSHPLRKHWKTVVALGLLGFLIYQLAFIIGIANTEAGSAALIMASGPLWTAGIGVLIGLERLPLAGWVGLFVTLGGTAVIVLGGPDQIDFGSDVFFGNIMMVLAAMLWGAYTAFSKPASNRITPTGIVFWGVTISLPFLIGIGIPHMSAVPWPEITWWMWAIIIFSGGLSTGLVVALWNRAVKSVGASQTAIYGNLVPVIALVSGAVLLGETITYVQIVGGVLIIGGLLLTRRTPSHVRHPVAPAEEGGKGGEQLAA